MLSIPQSHPPNDKDETDHIDGLFQNAVTANTNHYKFKDAAAALSKLPDSGQTEKLLARELNELSIKEREKVYENIHGVPDNNEENPDFVAQNMEAMERALQKIREKKVYDLAMSQSSTYVRSLYLRFLRSTNFEVKKSASKLVLFLELKQDLFGPELLGKRIEYADLSLDDQQCVQSGWHQVLPFRDRSGRTVVWQNHEARRKDISSLSNARALYYLSNLIFDDEETQKGGVVAVVFGDENEKMTPDSQDFLWKSSRFTAALPSRVVGHHICLQSKIMLPLVHLCVAALGREVRLHTRIHQGTYTETSYELMSFGIPVNYAPVSSGGKVKLKYHRQWLSRQFRLEQMRAKASKIPNDNINNGRYDFNDPSLGRIELPRRNDILVGTGVVAQNYSGNVQFLVLTAKYQEHYSKIETGEKRKIVEQMYELLHSKEYSARFLMRTSPDDWWTVAPREVALKKIAHRLRAKQPSKSASRELSLTNRNKYYNDSNNTTGDAMNVGTVFLNHSHHGTVGSCCLPGMMTTKKKKKELKH